jgi:iron(III) transport system substrate-binding protein
MSTARKGRIAAAIAALALSSLGISACGGSGNATSAPELSSRGYSDAWLRVVEAANKEGQVNVSSVLGADQSQAMIKAFNQEFPDIKVVVNNPMSSSNGAKQIDEQIKKDQLAYDVAINSQTTWATNLASQGSLVAPDGPATKGWDAKDYDNGLVKVEATPAMLSYNTQLVSEAPTSWNSMVDSKYEGRTGVWINAGAEGTVAFYRFLEDKMGAGWLEKLAALKPKLYTNSTSVAQAVASGEVAWANYGLASSAAPLKEKGAPIGWVVPKEGTVAFINYGLIFKQAANPNAARVFIDFLMSEAGQEVLTGNEQAYSFVNAKGSIQIEKGKVEFPTPADGVPATVNTSTDEFKRIFGG